MTNSLVDENPKQELETQQQPNSKEKEERKLLRMRWDWVEASIWTDSMLTALENGVKGGKWYSMYDKVYAPGTLWRAWIKVMQNKGAAGVDKITIERFEANSKRYLEELRKELMEGNYHPFSKLILA